jgi:hypothetical protein
MESEWKYRSGEQRQVATIPNNGMYSLLDIIAIIIVEKGLSVDHTVTLLILSPYLKEAVVSFRNF